MDVKDQVTKWVENKIEKVISKDLKEIVVEENSVFDVETYVNSLLEKYFTANDIERFKKNLNPDLVYFELEYSSDDQNSLHDSLDLTSNDCQFFIEEEIIKNLENESEEVQKKSLKVLYESVDLINQTSWNGILKILRNILVSGKKKEIKDLVLKILQKLLQCPKKPEIVCKTFTSVGRIISDKIHWLNIENENISIEEIYDLKEDKWYYEKNHLKINSSKHQFSRNFKHENSEILVKLMWLLIDCQQQLSLKWVQFNKTKFREIIFGFVKLLNSTTALENKKITGLELVSVLHPTARWSRYLCHTAIGRSLLCSALKKYKTFLIHAVEIILNHVRTKKTNRLPPIRKKIPINNNTVEDDNSKSKSQRKEFEDRSNFTHSAPVELHGNTSKNNSEWVIKKIPVKVVNEAVFCHSISFVTCLIQYQSGRALFPIQTKAKKGPLTIQDLSLIITEYLENLEYYEWDRVGIMFTLIYKAKLLEILNNLKNLKSNINSFRSLER